MAMARSSALLSSLAARDLIQQAEPSIWQSFSDRRRVVLSKVLPFTAQVLSNDSWNRGAKIKIGLQLESQPP
jgi:hypothetical protein